MRTSFGFNSKDGAHSEKGGKSKGKEKSSKSKGGKGSGACRFFRPYRKGGQGQEGQERVAVHLLVRRNVTEEEVEEEEPRMTHC